MANRIFLISLQIIFRRCDLQVNTSNLLEFLFSSACKTMGMPIFRVRSKYCGSNVFTEPEYWVSEITLESLTKSNGVIRTFVIENMKSTATRNQISMQKIVEQNEDLWTAQSDINAGLWKLW